MTLQVFPVLKGIVYPVTKSPNWATDTHRSVSGKRTTLQWYSYPTWSFQVAYSFLRSDTVNKEWQELVAFFNTVGGAAQLFRFNDPDDSSVTAGIFGTGDSTTATFQLLRTITGTNHNWNDPVFYPSTATIFDNGVAVGSSLYTITNGAVTFNTPPTNGHALTWTGSFDWLVRFDDNSASFEQFAHNFWELKQLKFSSEKI